MPKLKTKSGAKKRFKITGTCPTAEVPFPAHFPKYLKEFRHGSRQTGRNVPRKAQKDP
jgi:ribosomal protein L35